MIHLIGTKLMNNLMHSLYLYMQLDAKLPRDYYLRRLKIFFNYLDLKSDETIEER